MKVDIKKLESLLNENKQYSFQDAVKEVLAIVGLDEKEIDLIIKASWKLYNKKKESNQTTL
jgi:spore coat protein CotH